MNKFKVGDRVVNKLGLQGIFTKTDRVSEYTIEVLFADSLLEYTHLKVSIGS